MTWILGSGACRLFSKCFFPLVFFRLFLKYCALQMSSSNAMACQMFGEHKQHSEPFRTVSWTISVTILVWIGPSKENLNLDKGYGKFWVKFDLSRLIKIFASFFNRSTIFTRIDGFVWIFEIDNSKAIAFVMLVLSSKPHTKCGQHDINLYFFDRKGRDSF